MKNYFKVTVKSNKIDNKGKEQRVSEHYLIDAISFTEAETAITKEFAGTGEFEISAIQKKNYADIFSSDIPEEKWFECKVNFIIFDEKTASEKKTSVLMLINANSVNSANDTLIEKMTGTVSDYEIESVKDSKIMEVYFCEIDCNFQ